MRRTVAWLGLAILVALLIVHAAQRQLAPLWRAFGVSPEVSAAIEASMEDQKRLARLDPANTAGYRARFDALRALRNRLEIVRMAQTEIARTQERILFLIVAGTLAAIAAVYLVRRRREVRRLARIESFLERLSAGEANLTIRERGGDAIATMAAMIERTSAAVGAERRRLRTLENLSVWQEAARRHAHEIRTPLTAAQLEIDRLATEAAQRDPESAAAVRDRHERIRRELDRLAGFTKSFTSFAAIAHPAPTRADLADLVREFCETFRAAWPLGLDPAGLSAACPVETDRGLLRQVLVNLCANSALAGARRVTFSIRCGASDASVEVADDGPGLPDAIRTRLFQPYTTTRGIGEGMGLGLAISKKIMLDLGGDLELVGSSREGTRFRLTVPRGEAACT